MNQHSLLGAVTTLILLSATLVGCPATVDGWPRECPSPLDEGVWYHHATWEARDQCAWVDVVCPQGTVALFEEFPRIQGNDCGCGCFGTPEDGWPPQWE